MPSWRVQGQFYVHLFIVIMVIIIIVVVVVVVVSVIADMQSQRPTALLSNITNIVNHLVECFILCRCQLRPYEYGAHGIWTNMRMKHWWKDSDVVVIVVIIYCYYYG
jgi:cytochrome c biogenesis factor